MERHLAACVNVLPHMRSVYRWKGGIESAVECLLVIKIIARANSIRCGELSKRPIPTSCRKPSPCR